MFKNGDFDEELTVGVIVPVTVGSTVGFLFGVVVVSSSIIFCIVGDEDGFGTGVRLGCFVVKRAGNSVAFSMGD